MERLYRVKKKIQQEYDKISEARLETTVQCTKCGHKMVIPAREDKILCTWCNNKIINDTKVHFMRKMRVLLGKQKGLK